MMEKKRFAACRQDVPGGRDPDLEQVRLWKVMLSDI